MPSLVVDQSRPRRLSRLKLLLVVAILVVVVRAYLYALAVFGHQLRPLGLHPILLLCGLAIVIAAWVAILTRRQGLSRWTAVLAAAAGGGVVMAAVSTPVEGALLGAVPGALVAFLPRHASVAIAGAMCALATGCLAGTLAHRVALDHSHWRWLPYLILLLGFAIQAWYLVRVISKGRRRRFDVAGRVLSQNEKPRRPAGAAGTFWLIVLLSCPASWLAGWQLETYHRLDLLSMAAVSGTNRPRETWGSYLNLWKRHHVGRARFRNPRRGQLRALRVAQTVSSVWFTGERTSDAILKSFPPTYVYQFDFSGTRVTPAGLEYLRCTPVATRLTSDILMDEKAWELFRPAGNAVPTTDGIGHRRDAVFYWARFALPINSETVDLFRDMPDGVHCTVWAAAEDRDDAIAQRVISQITSHPNVRLAGIHGAGPSVRGHSMVTIAHIPQAVEELRDPQQTGKPWPARINARAVLATVGQPAIPALAAALRHSDSGVRQGAALTLGDLGTPPETVEELLRLLDDDSVDVVAAAASVLSARPERVAPALLRFAGDPDPRARRIAVGTLVSVEPKVGVEARELVRLLRDPDETVRQTVANGFDWSSAAAQSALVEELRSDDVRRRLAAATFLASRMGDEKIIRDTVAVLLEASTAKDEFGEQASGILDYVGGDAVTAILLEQLRAGDVETQRRVARVFARRTIYSPKQRDTAIQLLEKICLGDVDQDLKREALHALGGLDLPAAGRILEAQPSLGQDMMGR